MTKRKVPKLITIAILTLITAVFWVFFSAYRAFTDEPDQNIEDSILAPLNPVLDSQTLSLLNSRIYLKQDEVSLLVSQYESQVPTPEPNKTPEPDELEKLEDLDDLEGEEATESATPTQSPEPSGEES